MDPSTIPSGSSPPPRRRPPGPGWAVAAIVGVLVAVVVGGVWFTVGRAEVQLVEVEVFEPPASLCDAGQERSFAEQVAAIEGTTPDDLRADVATVEAHLARQLAAIDERDGELQRALERYAEAVEAGAASGAFAKARAAAEAVDEEVRVRCS